MSRDKTLVLGSGISALAYLLYDESAFALAGDQVGGLFKMAADLGPQLIWKTESTSKLLSDLGVKNMGYRVVKVGYYYAGKLWSEEELDPEVMKLIRREYSFKTRGTEPRGSHMSSGKGSFEVFDLPVQELVSMLMDRVSLRLIREKALKVDLYERRIETSGRTYHYDDLVSTVPAPVLLKLTGNEHLVGTLTAYDKVYQKVTGDTEDHFFVFEREALSRGFEYVYCPDEGAPFHRTRIIPGDGFDGLEGVVREYTLTPALRGGGSTPEGILQKGGQIVGGGEVLRSLPPSVRLLGRYASWKHEVRLEHVLDEIGEAKKTEKI